MTYFLIKLYHKLRIQNIKVYIFLCLTYLPQNERNLQTMVKLRIYSKNIAYFSNANCNISTYLSIYLQWHVNQTKKLLKIENTKNLNFK